MTTAIKALMALDAAIIMSALLVLMLLFSQNMMEQKLWNKMQPGHDRYHSCMMWLGFDAHAPTSANSLVEARYCHRTTGQ